MTTCEANGISEPAVDALAIAIQALRRIFDGCSATGRWLCVEDLEAVGHDPASPDPGYYDCRNPPSGYTEKGWIGARDNREEPQERLKPCEWEDYDQEEQTRWLETCARTAKRALEGIGVSLCDPGEEGSR
jgi:hypothetical protein